MAQVDLLILTLGDKFQDYRYDIYGNSFTFGPLIYAPNVQFLTVHHSVTAQTAKDDGNWKAECDVIARHHVDGNGWAGVGYQFIVCSDGTVAYVSDLSHGGANVYLHNDINFGICMVGDFTKQLPTDAQIESIHKLIWHLLNMPQYPSLQLKDPSEFDRHVRGHKDWCNKETGDNCTLCPGESWPNDMKYRIKYGVVYTPRPQVVEVPVIEDKKEEVPVSTPVSTEPTSTPVSQPQEEEEVIVIEPHHSETVTLPAEPPIPTTYKKQMRHVDYFMAVIHFFIRIFNKKII
jgi:hypothetical protein